MDINIPENKEKGNPTSLKLRGAGLKPLFWPVLMILVGFAAFGIGKLHTIGQMRQPVTIEYTPIASSSPMVLGTTTASTSLAKATTTPQVKTGKYVASRGGTVYYLPSCAASKRIAEKNKIWFDTKAEAEKFGYKSAQNCKGI